MQSDETPPKYVGYVENILQETITTQRKWISKVYNELSSNLEPKVVRYQPK
jgi:hypothetical protein